MGSLGLLVEACIKREDEDEDESFSEEDEQHEEESMIDEHSSYTCAPCNPSSIAPIACFSSNQISKKLLPKYAEGKHSWKLLVHSKKVHAL